MWTMAIEGVLPTGYTIVVVLEAVFSLAAVTVLGGAYLRRRSRSYLLVTLALSTLLVRSATGLLSVADIYPATAFETLDHGLDIVMVSLLLGAVYYARRIDSSYTNP
jgi:hypothetical protein